MVRKAKSVIKSDAFKNKLKENKAFSKLGEISNKEFIKRDNLLKRNIIRAITNLVSEISSGEELVKNLSKKLGISVKAKEIKGVKSIISKESIVTLSLVSNRNCSKTMEIQRIGNNAKVVGIEICEQTTSKEWWISVKEVNSTETSKELNELSTKHLLNILQNLEKSIK